MRRNWLRLSLIIVVALAVRSAAANGGLPPIEQSEWDQYLLELTNRARADPDAEAARFGIDLNEGLTPGTIASGPRQPLAFHGVASRAAYLHTEDILANMTALPPDHRGSDGRDPGQRLTDAGVVYSGYSENNSWSSASAISKAAVDQLHLLLFKDFTSSFQVVGRGHRKVILNGARNQVGVAALAGLLGSKKVAICTEDYVTTSQVFITGVVFSDVVLADGFYTPGEGLRNVQVQAVRTSDALTLSTWPGYAGGYAIAAPPGTYDVTASGGQFTSPQTVFGVVVGSENVKVDFMTTGVTPLPMPKFQVLSAGGKALTGGGYSLALKKCILSPGMPYIYASDVDDLVVRIDGVPFFAAADRAAVKSTLNADGRVLKLGITDTSGNKLALDVVKRTLKIAMKAAPGINPGDGTVVIEILGDTFMATVRPAALIVGTKLLLRPAVGEVSLP